MNEDATSTRETGPHREPVAPLKTLATLARLARSDGRELCVEIQGPPDGPPIVSLRIFRGSNDVPTHGRGFSLRSSEVSAVIAALARALDFFREDERTRRKQAEKNAANLRRAAGHHRPPPRAA